MSIYSNSIDTNFLPNLPGFRPKSLPTGFKKKYFEVVNGIVVEKEPFLPQLEAPEDQSVNSIGNATASLNKRKGQQTTGLTLTFQGFFEERPFDSSAASHQIRKCNIYYFIDDGSIRIVEKPQLNSGVPQGTLVRRAIVTKSDGSPITEKDLVLGEDITVYGRTYRITDCDVATRKYLESKLHMSVSGSISIPKDSYQEYRMSLQPGHDADEWGKFHSKKNDSKTFAEADIGHYVDNSGREGFIRFGNRSLQFRCVWDNTGNLYGDVNEYTLQYYLSDDTIEICSIPNPNIKEQGPSKLLKRAKLPKKFVFTTDLSLPPNPKNFFHWTDIYIGLHLTVYGRDLQVMDADRTTRDFYQSFDFTLADAIVIPKPIVTIQKREIPPPTGFGSEEDSMRSVSGSLLPGPMPTKKLGENKVLSFLCSLLSGGPDDVNRRFVLSYYVMDQTLKIAEPPIRNSGFVGGVFLSKRAIKKANGDTLTEKDLFLGAKVQILKHRFLLLESSEDALRWMEDKGFPHSNFYLILDQIRPVLYNDASNGNLALEFQQYETSETGPGQATKDTLKQVLMKYGCVYDADGNELLYDHDLVTINRINQGVGVTFNYEVFIREILAPSGEFKLCQ